MENSVTWSEEQLRNFFTDDDIENFLEGCNQEELVQFARLVTGVPFKYENNLIIGPSEEEEYEDASLRLPFGPESPEAIAKFFEVIKQEKNRLTLNLQDVYEVPKDIPVQIFGHARSNKTAMQVLKMYLVKHRFIEIVRRGTPTERSVYRILKEPKFYRQLIRYEGTINDQALLIIPGWDLHQGVSVPIAKLPSGAKVGDRLFGYVNLHAKSHEELYPHGFTIAAEPDDEDDLGIDKNVKS